MDDRSISDQSSDSSDDHSEIVNGFFGINNEENGTEYCSIHSDCEDELNMDTDDQTIFNNDKSSEKTMEDSSYKQLTNNCTEIVKNACFGSHIFDLKSKESNPSDLPSSFAKITEDYEKSMENMSKHVVETSTNDSQVSQLELNSTPKANLQSLSMISNNYQDSSSESDVSCNKGDQNCDDSDDDISIISVSSNQTAKECVKTRGELDITDLPPIEDLKISIGEEKCQPVGCVKSFVDTLVIVEAFFNQPALDIDSILFLDRGKRALGRIFDVFGPVNKPYYAVRFNNSDHIKKFNVVVKEPVFCAPETEYSSFVLISQLLKMKGSDASWRHNNEPPPEFLDYSDDEAEKLAKKKRKQKKNRNGKNNNDKGDPPEPPSQNNVTRSRSVSVDSTQRQSFPRNFNQTPRTYSPRPPNFSACSSNYNPHPPNFNLRPPSFNPSPQSYGYDQQPPPPFLSYAQQLSAMDYSNSYRQPFYPQYYNQNIMYPPRPSFPYHNQQTPQGFSHQPFPRTNPNNPSHPVQMHYPH